MAVPFRRTSKTKKRMRRTHLKIDARTTVVCSNCGEVIQPHRACTKCGFYKGKNILNRDEVAEATKTKAVKEVKNDEVKEDKKTTAKKTTTKKTSKSKETK